MAAAAGSSVLGVPLQGDTLGMFLDADPSGAAGLRAVINWGNGTPDSRGAIAGTTSTSAGALLAVREASSSTHAYANGGVYTVVTSVIDPQGIGIILTRSIRVSYESTATVTTGEVVNNVLEPVIDFSLKKLWIFG